MGAAVPEGQTRGVETSAVSGPQVSLGQDLGTGQAPPKPESASVPTASMPASSTTDASSEPRLAYVPPPTPAAPSTAPMGSAVQSLVSQADAKYLAGDLTGAASLLERAVRVEPRHPLPWNRLARVRLAQSSFGLAEELAKKSNALAGSDRALQRANWQMIAEAQQAQGNSAGASAARQKANELR